MEEPKERPEVLAGPTVKVETAQCENCYVTVNMLDGCAWEVWIKHGKGGACEQAHKYAIGVLLSAALQAGSNPEKLARRLMNIGCLHPNPWGKTPNISCIDGIAKAILKAVGKGQEDGRVHDDSGATCPHP